MQGKCYYCGKELTERTIKRHMKNCSEMKKVIEEKTKSTKALREQFIISMKDKYAPSVYCIYVSIDANLQLQHLDKFIRDVWVECCGHLSAFYIDGQSYNDNSDEQYEMNFYLKDLLSVNKKFEYQYDFGSTTHLILEVIDIIKVPKEFSQIEVIARNDQLEEGEYCNSPRDGVCGYVGSKDDEIPYLPQNDAKHKISKNKPVLNDYDWDDYENDEFNEMIQDEFLDYFEKEYDNVATSLGDMFFKGKYSFDLEELIKSCPKKRIDLLAKNIDLKLPSNLNKSKAIEKYVNEFEDCIRNKLNIFTEELYKALLKCVKNNGIIRISEDDIECDGDKYVFLMNMAIIFPSSENGEPIFIMPEVMQNVVKQCENMDFRRLMKKNSETLNIFKGMIEAYGILYSDDIKGLIERYKIDIDEATLLLMLEQGSFYNTGYHGTIDENGKVIFINDKIEDYEEIINEIDKNLDYVFISKEELIFMAKEEYLKKSSIGKKFIKEFSSMFMIDREDLIENANILALDIQYRNSKEIIKDMLEAIGEQLDSEEESEVCTSINKLIKNIRLWKYKGATINEREKNNKHITSKKTVGRNESCPCGSGKKFKNCCARN